MNKEEKIIAKNRNWFDKWADSYDKFFLKRLLHYWQNKAIEELTEKEKKVLEISYGTGGALEKIASGFRKAKIYGLELSPNMKKEANKRLKKYKNIKLFVGNVSKIQFKNNYFNFIFSTESFHHYPNAEKAICEMARVLKKGGKLVIVDLVIKPLFLFNILWKLDIGFVRMYSQKEMIKLFEKNDLKVVKQERCGVFAVKTVGIKE